MYFFFVFLNSLRLTLFEERRNDSGNFDTFVKFLFTEEISTNAGTLLSKADVRGYDWLFVGGGHQ